MTTIDPYLQKLKGVADLLNRKALVAGPITKILLRFFIRSFSKGLGSPLRLGHVPLVLDR